MTPKDKAAVLMEILTDMKINPACLDFEKPGNLVWINRHLAMNNLNHPRSEEARSLLQSLMMSYMRS